MAEVEVLVVGVVVEEELHPMAFKNARMTPRIPTPCARIDAEEVNTARLARYNPRKCDTKADNNMAA
jgi:hypothetical protein